MEFLKKIGSWANHLTEIGISVIALGVVLEVLFKGANIPFWPEVSVVDNIMGILGGCLLYTSPSPRDATLSRMPSSA